MRGTAGAKSRGILVCPRDARPGGKTDRDRSSVRDACALASRPMGQSDEDARSEAGANASATRIALVTAPDEAVATELARAWVERGLAACVNVVPGLTSVYRWEGAVESARECL